MEIVEGAVSKVLGQNLGPEVPVMSAGLDSLGTFDPPFEILLWQL